MAASRTCRTSLANVLVDQARARSASRAHRARASATPRASPGANPPLWAGHLLANRDALVARARRRGRGASARCAQRWRAGDRDALERWQAAAAGAPRRAAARPAAHGGPTRELRVVVPNRPGVVAELALTLSRAGINIADMCLSPSPGLRAAARSPSGCPPSDADRAASCSPAWGSTHERPLRAERAAARRADRRRRTSRSRTARRSRRDGRRAGRASATTSTPRTRNSTLDAVRALGALVEVRPDELVIRGTGLREARASPTGRSTSATPAR